MEVLADGIDNVRLNLMRASPLEPASCSQLEPPVPSPVRRLFFCALVGLFKKLATGRGEVP